MNFVSVQKLLNDIDNEMLMLPNFQRSFVWKRPDIREFIDSVYRAYPVGALTTWQTERPIDAGGGSRLDGRQDPINYILDGQQRITSLYGVIRGKLPPFHSSTHNPTEGLLFHVKDRRFAFERTADVRDNPEGLWVNVTRLFQDGGLASERAGLVERARPKQDDLFDYNTAMERLVSRLTEVELPVLELQDSTLSVEEVVEIFNKINKGGKKLTAYELAFAVLSVGWPEVRTDFQNVVDGWAGRIEMDIDLLLRIVNAVATNSGKLSIEKVPVQDVKRLLRETAQAVDHILNLLADRLGLDYPRVLKQRLPLAVMAKFVVQNGGRVRDPLQRDKLLCWYVFSAVFGTYLQAPESRITRDLAAITNQESDGLQKLIDNIKLDRPELRIVESDLDSTWSSSTFFTILYMLTRVYGARDWDTGEPLRHGMLGQNSKLEMHHIFPKNLLSTAGKSNKQANNLANFAFQTSLTNKSIGASDPADYLAAISKEYPGALESQWVPMERSHWQVANYDDFLRGRQGKLAEAANEFLDRLRSGRFPDSAAPNVRPTEVVVVDPEDDERARKLIEDFIEYAPGVTGHLIDVPGQNPVYLDVAWPSGLQFGVSEPVTFLFDADDDVIQQANQAGFRVFTVETQLRQYAHHLARGDGN